MRLIRTIALASVSFAGLAAAIPVAQARMVCREVVDEAPPPLPEYQQPPIPGPGYVWTPGYWSVSDDSGYYWVPGTWAQPPRPGLLWTPGYWGWSDGAFLFHAGYWAATVGYYGGVNYGYGYGGSGYQGGYWRGDNFFYNRTVNNINNVAITNVYEKPVIVNRGPRVSYSGGPGGVVATPTQQEAAIARQERIPPTQAQVTHVQMAAKNPALQLKQNNGHPPIAATPRPAEFNVPGATAGRPGPGAPHAGPAVTPQGLPHAPGQAEPPRPGAAGAQPPMAHPAPGAATIPPGANPHALPVPHEGPGAAKAPPALSPRALPAPRPAPAMLHAPPAVTPHPQGAMPRPPIAAPHAPPPMAMPHPEPAMPRPQGAMPHPAPGMPHPPAAMPHPGAPHAGPAERGRPGQEPRP
ncbi:hypothetical protein [Rhodoblastus sp.]|uniref:hypothetical protein n=1 Tax=Rhodoblastus sp. TaxID=1962975 RepID=UPI00262E6003|nr:hypothetical protein [Rhodoblastus sp.]